ncbi:MAG: YkvA family protein [Bacilli bacterium]
MFVGALTIFQKLKVLYQTIRHPQLPKKYKALMILAIAYVFVPIDLLPDWMPVLGITDDAILFPLSLLIISKLAPKSIREECTALVLDADQRMNNNIKRR